jgi:hypothetical protein
MTINSMISFATIVGSILMGISVVDFVRSHGFFAAPALADYSDNLVVLALGAILWCFAAVLICLVAIDKKLHE